MIKSFSTGKGDLVIGFKANFQSAEFSERLEFHLVFLWQSNQS